MVKSWIIDFIIVWTWYKNFPLLDICSMPFISDTFLGLSKNKKAKKRLFLEDTPLQTQRDRLWSFYEIYNRGRWDSHYGWFHHHQLRYKPKTRRSSTLLQHLYVSNKAAHTLQQRTHTYTQRWNIHLTYTLGLIIQLRTFTCFCPNWHRISGETWVCSE